MGGKYFFDRYTPAERLILIEECGLTQQEAEVFEARARVDSVVGAQMRVMTSDTTIKRRSRAVAQKLARCGHRRHMGTGIKENCI